VNLTNNTITTTGTQSFGISISTSSRDTEQDITNTIINSTATWILFDKSVGQSILTNLTNTTFLDADGSINLNGSISIDESLDVNQTYLNITPNRAFLNSTNLTVLNQSARITLENV